MRISTAVVLAGARGLRLAPLTNSLPKALLRIRCKPLLEWVIDWFAKNGVRDLVIGVAYDKEKIMNYFGDGSRFGLRIRYSVHTVEGGTAERFRKAIQGYVTDQTFLAMNADELTNLNVEKFCQLHVGSGVLVTVAVTELRGPSGIVSLDSDGFPRL